MLNINRFASHSSHIMIWFDMQEYNYVFGSLLQAGFQVNPHPLVWNITGDFTNRALIKPNYKTAFIATHHNRPFVKQISASYSAPLPSKPFHPEQLPKQMLKHFFQLFIDPITTFFDPTCGSGMSLQAAEELGAERVFGIEIDGIFSLNANLHIQKNRITHGITSNG